jgi:hypothetical protein
MEIGQYRLSDYSKDLNDIYTRPKYALSFFPVFFNQFPWLIILEVFVSDGAYAKYSLDCGLKINLIIT